MHADNELRRRLGLWIAEELEARLAVMASGKAADYADYKERCGYIKALRDVEQAADKLLTDMLGPAQGTRTTEGKLSNVTPRNLY